MTGAAVAALSWPAAAAADPATDARIAALEAQVNALSAQIADLKASTSGDVETLTAQVSDLKTSSAADVAALRTESLATTVSLANGRPTFASSDGAFTASLRGVFQLDAAHYDQDSPGPLATDFRRGSVNDAAENDRARDLNDGANFRRARIGIEGKAFRDVEYNFLYDFGGSGVEEAGKISAAWVQYNGLGKVRLRIGAFSPPAGLEEAVSTNGSLFAERASPSELVRGIASGDGRTAVGLFANGDRWNVSGALSGNVIGAQTFDEQLAFVGRAAFVPFLRDNALIHLGVNTSIVLSPAATAPDVAGAAPTTLRLRDRPELRVDGTRLVDTGNIDADGLVEIGAELGGQYKNFYGQAEYFDIKLDRKGALSDPKFKGWYVQGGWTITGEKRRYAIASATFDSPRPDKPFNPKDGGWGAWELGLRYSKLDLNFNEGAPGTAAVASAIRGGEQEIFTVGLNWYLNNVLRFQAAVQDVKVDRLSAGGSTFIAGSTPPAGAQVGQDLRIYSLRTQYAF
ncbi:OprO/OprP family phosphate-selective porin [Phenylobacterium sp.]|uniref:OprO/OprP family phosphate-selective porin n=1 Tax=Phenylobacterium sp. TaxID=1871053 RepID=UPI002732B90B|nr:porin [Phenylobacterium sp.]MDP3659963.1 porin [Phenylobacterium sp.]